MDSVGCVLSLGPQPLKPGEVWLAEIAVVPPGDQVPDQSGWRTRFMAALVIATAVVLGTWLLFSPSSSTAMPKGIPQMLEGLGLIVPDECGCLGLSFGCVQ